MIIAGYSTVDVADMHMIRGGVHGSGYVAALLYRERYPQRRPPDRSVFERLDRNLREWGQFVAPTAADGGPPRDAGNVQLEEAILDSVANAPTTSTRRVGHRLHTSHRAVWRVLHEDGQYPYHGLRVQCLLPQDYEPRVHLCRWLLRRVGQNADFLADILWTDEASFSRGGTTNMHNAHVWTHKNPHWTRNSRFHHEFRINVWAGTVG